VDKTFEEELTSDPKQGEPLSGIGGPIGNGEMDPHVVAYFDRRSPAAAQYRTLRTNLLKADPVKPPVSVLITSSAPREGKSLTAVNLAVTLAGSEDARVILVDADMRDPTIHRLLGVDNKRGLADYLAGEAVLGQSIRATAVPNLFLLSAGRIPGNPTKLLSSTRLRDLIRRLSNDFDHVIIDTPPVVTFTDAAVVAPYVDGVVLVAKAGETPRKDAAQAQFLLGRVDSRILGTVLTHV
jgi:succinoglycan biosynthesis transport protein ExoP